MVLNSSIFKLLVLCFALWAGLFYVSIESTVAIWYRSETFAHCFIILPICLYLIKLRWQKLNEATVEPNLKVLLLLFPVLCLWLFGSLAKLLVIEQGAAFLALPFIIWTVMGYQVTRILAFTLGFWMFSVPVGEFLIPQLQELTADITVWALQLSGIPVYREGLYLAVPGGLFEVAVACSGIRYLIASFTLGTLFAYLNYNSAKKRTLFIIFSIVLPLFANGIRAFGIVLIAYLSDMKYATGVDHLIYGWFFFGVVILIMFAIGNIWADPLEPQDDDAPKTVNRAGLIPSVKALSVVVVLVLLSFGYKGAIENPLADINPALNTVFHTNKNIDDTSWMPTFQNATNELSGNGEDTDFYLAYYDKNIQGQELINSTNSIYDGKKWTIVSSQTLGDYVLLEITNTAGEFRLIAYTYATSWIVSPSALKVKLSQAIQAFLGIPQTGLVVVLSKAVDEADRETVLKDIREEAGQTLNSELKTLLSGD